MQVDLPSQLGLDLVHCERAAEAVVAAGGGGITLAQGELFSTAYFDNLAAEVDEGLQETGVVSGGCWRRLAVRCVHGARPWRALWVPAKSGCADRGAAVEPIHGPLLRAESPSFQPGAPAHHALSHTLPTRVCVRPGRSG